MTDCFALLGEPRRPWLDPDSLKEKFHKLGATHHPDVAQEGGGDFTAITTAYKTLLDPKTRIRHLLELEFPDALSRSLEIPPGITGLFEAIARHRSAIPGFLSKRAAAQSPLETALLTPEKLELIASTEHLQNILLAEQEEFYARLKTLDGAWRKNSAASADPLLEIYQSLSYTGKWLAQVQEDAMRLKEA